MGTGEVCSRVRVSRAVAGRLDRFYRFSHLSRTDLFVYLERMPSMFFLFGRPAGCFPSPLAFLQAAFLQPALCCQGRPAAFQAAPPAGFLLGSAGRRHCGMEAKGRRGASCFCLSPHECGSCCRCRSQLQEQWGWGSSCLQLWGLPEAAA